MLAEPPTVKNLKPVQLTSADQAYMDMVFISERVFERLVPISGLPRDSKFIYVKLKGYIFTAGKANIGDLEIAIGKIQRGYLRIGLTDLCDITLWIRPTDREVRLSNLQLELEGKVFVSAKKLEIDEVELGKSFRKICKDHVFQPGQVVLLDYFGNVFEGRVNRTQLVDIGVEKAKTEPNVPGILVDETDIEFSSSPNDKFSMKSSGNKVQNIFQPDFDFDKLGVGGLNREIGDIFRRAFASRRFPPSVLKKYGIRHIKGVLLYGPPGTGKTLMARQLSKALRSKEPKIINGPELFDKYVGETEKKIRELFSEAIADQKQYGEESQLHILIFDEFDSICRQRGSISSGTGVHDSAVNQLLAMMDGVEALNNILLIGMTNRKDMLDEAVLRPGRFEVHIEVGLPDEKGRLQILNIHTKQMQANKLLAPDVSFDELAKKMKNYTGAEIEAVVKSASSFAFNRGNDVADFSKKISAVNEECKVEMQDFELALEEVRPQFGADLDRFEMYLRGGMIDYGARLKKNQDMLRTVMNQLRTSKNQQLVSLLLEGETGAGKTALASWGATTSDFPYIKVISADNMLGLSDVGKINAIVKVFEDAYRTQLAVIVLDDIERLVEFVDIGSRFSNPLLQTLLVLIKRIPPKIQNKLVVLGTTTSLETMKEIGIAQSFNFTVHVPTLSAKDNEIKNVLLQHQVSPREAQAIADLVPTITIKKLLLVLEMTGHKGSEVTYERFSKAYHDYIA